MICDNLYDGDVCKRCTHAATLHTTLGCVICNLGEQSAVLAKIVDTFSWETNMMIRTAQHIGDLAEILVGGFEGVNSYTDQMAQMFKEDECHGSEPELPDHSDD